jgi:hypothetical protein
MVVVLLVALTNVALAPENDTFDANELTGLASLEVLSVGTLIHFLLLIFLINGISVFNLIVRYKGGHTGQNYFNDRTIENSKLSLSAIYPMTTQLGVVICFSPSFPLPGSEK